MANTKFGIIRKQPNPPSLSNLKVWVKANVGVTLNGTKVTTWADQSGNNNNLVNTSPRAGHTSSQPSLTTNSVNGLPSIYFGGTSATKFLSCNDVSLTSGATILFVYKAPTQFNNIHTPISTNSTSTGTNNSTKDLYLEYSTGVYSGNGSFTIPSDNGTSFRIMTITDAGTTTAISAYKNGSILGGSATSQGYSFGRLGASPAGINYSTSNQDYYIAEVLVYNTKLSNIDRQSAESYLNTKYAIY